MKSENQDIPLSALDDISYLLTVSNFNLDILLDEICWITAHALRVKACAIRLLDVETGEMALKSAHGLSPQYLTKGPVIAAKSAFRDVIETGEVTQIFDASRDPRLQYSKAAVAEGIRSRLDAGLIRDDKAIGALSVFTDQPHHFTEGEVQTFQTLANQAAVAVYLAQFHQEKREMEQIAHELAIAADVQKKFMPIDMPQIEGMELVAFNCPCEAVGGDFYDFIDLPGENLGIALGDVSGKGIPAALLMATICTALRVQVENVYAMREVIGRVNRALCKNSRLYDYATLFYAVLDVKQRRLTYVNAGHNFPLLFRGDQIIRLQTGGMIVGMYPEATYEEGFISLKPDDILVIYTDGFTEVSDDRDEPFGEERLRQVIHQHRCLNAEDIVRKLENVVSGFECPGSESCDDRTLVVLKVHQ